MKTVFSSLCKIKNLTHLLVPTIHFHLNHPVVYFCLKIPLLFCPTSSKRGLICVALFMWPMLFCMYKSLDFVLVFVTIQPDIMRIWPYTNVASVEHIERD